MSTKHRTLRRGPPRALVIALASALALMSCTGGESPPAALPSPPVATPTPAPADPDLARFYQRNGQYEEAIAVLQAIVASSGDPVQHEARLPLALAYLESESYGDALSEMDAYLESGPPPAQAARARFLRARALIALDRPGDAADDFARYAATGGPAAAYARIGRARALALVGRPEEAAAEAERALAQNLPPAVAAGAVLLVAQSLEQAGESSSAGRWYGRLAQQSASPADRALARWRQADMARLAGDPSWAEDARAVMAAYPATAAALEALQALQEAEERIDRYWAGVVFYRHFRDEDAVDVLQANLESPAPSHTAESFYYLAIALERLGRAEDALEAYERSLVEDPAGPLADDAAWWRARLLEATGRLSEAHTAYAELLLRYSGSPWVSDARFRRGLVLYKQARFDEAASAWRSTLSPRQSSEEQGRILLWLAKVERKRGHSAGADSNLRRLAALADAGFYSRRAVALLQDEARKAPVVDITPPPPDWSAAEAWAAALEPATALLFDPATDERWLRGSELVAVGLYEEAGGEFRAVLSDNSSSPARLYIMARALSEMDQTHLAARAATMLLESLPAAVAEAAPPAVWRLAYPTGFATLVETAARRENVPPELLLALIRQESFFDPRAGSVAGALGLTQVMPATGQAIAEDLGEATDFEPGDLLRPAVSVRFGTRYLKRQLEQFDGAVIEALAAYNGGPGHAAGWSAAAGGDPDLFLEEIDLAETRDYVRLVSENLARYEELYAVP